MNVHGSEIKLFTGNSNPVLAQEISDALGIPLGKCDVGKFTDGETSVSVYETVRGCDVFVIQSTAEHTNDNLMELLVMIDAFKRASAGRITAVVPYYGYARQDRKAKGRDPITSKLVADMLMVAGADRILTMDLHAPQIQGFFNIPVDHLVGSAILAPYLLKKFGTDNPDLVVMSPDVGSINRARKFAEYFNAPIAIVDKRRPKANVSEVMNIIGDVRDKDIIIFDDMVDTAGTLYHAAFAIKEAGARSITATATHPVLSGPAVERIQESPIDQLVVLDTINVPESKRIDKITVLPAGGLFAEAIEHVYADKPMSPLVDKMVETKA
ncbi:MAG: ribose-phosphate pyrophosphokinase [Oscillospiraceae bacterium]|nr:ribose-phosphate pyrophosphokinase [Oscillospiraceae bacterium]